MAISLKWYSDAALLLPLEDPLLALQDQDGVLAPADFQVFLGAVGLFIYEMVSAPSVDNFILSVVDDLGGSGPQDAPAITLALTEAELDTNTPGAPLDLQVVTVYSGVAGAIPVWVRVNDLSALKGTYTNLHIDLPEVLETL
jgi:hypothetical protein